jgi:type IV secretion system protein VirB9
MDARRFLIAAVAAPLVGGSAGWTASPEAAPTARPYVEAARPPARSGRSAIAAAVSEARAASTSDRFEGGVQVFAWAPGRVYEVWTAPLRVTALSLEQGEVLISRAAGDTVRWQLGEARSGEGAGARTHVLLKPLQQGLETNLVLTTDRRVYLVHLRSGGTAAFNPAVAWDDPAIEANTPLEVKETDSDPQGVATPQAPLNTLYAVERRGRASWAPSAVFDDGRRTFIRFPESLAAAEAPALFVLGADGTSQYVNYRQAGGFYIVDRLFDRAELRLGDRRTQVVRITRLPGARHD